MCWKQVRTSSKTFLRKSDSRYRPQLRFPARNLIVLCIEYQLTMPEKTTNCLPCRRRFSRSRFLKPMPQVLECVVMMSLDSTKVRKHIEKGIEEGSKLMNRSLSPDPFLSIPNGHSRLVVRAMPLCVDYLNCADLPDW